MLFNEFKYFGNMFFLVTAISQFIPVLKVGLIFSFVSPLVFVLIVTMVKEAYDDIQRYQRDKQLNNTKYELLKVNQSGSEENAFIDIKSKDLKVGQIIKIKQGQRVPADLLLLYTTDKTGSCFIKTD